MTFQTMATLPDSLQNILPTKQDIIVASSEVAPSVSFESSEVNSDDDTVESPQDALVQPLELEEKSTLSDIEVSDEQNIATGLISLQILQVVATYGSVSGQSDAARQGFSAYLPLVEKQVHAGEPIQLLLSGFPFKAPFSSGHVLGQTPDLGEQLALEHLNGICSNIAAIYDKGAKIFICSNGLLPTVLSPWNSCTAVELDGSYRCASANELRNNEAYELIYGTGGAPSHYRAKSDMWDWKADGIDVDFEHLYPTGIIVRPKGLSPAEAQSMLMLPMKKVRSMSQHFSPIVLRGFKDTTEEEHFLAKGHELGEILTWTFGQILKVKDSGEVDRNANNVTSNEAMPMHFDGVFKFIDKVDPETGAVTKVLTPPRYQYFTCLSTAPKGDGYTLFADSRLFFQHLPSPFSLSRLERLTWSMVNDGFWSAKQTGLPLVVKHKETGAACLRWHQPWTKTKFSKYFIEIENDEASEELVDVINTLLYDYRVCLRFEWEQGDLLINDNDGICWELRARDVADPLRLSTSMNSGTSLGFDRIQDI
ncbi:hypothetical protein DE146DRAFT_723272 [Phaeosphaeria sp. MPI-PUGE-AT-0046c]|nr:hypothetical protein DE146DRAFT_723272 [Phaeosphaeria sp. MPI-PUGE-AT-0046c]